jgi:hypothetical protein
MILIAASIRAERQFLDMNRLVVSYHLPRNAAMTLAALALSACGSLVPPAAAPESYGDGYGNGGRGDVIQVGTGRDYPRAPRPADQRQIERHSSSRQSPALGSAPAAYGAHPDDRTCFAELDATGARFSRVPDRYAAPGCNTLGTVRLTALSGDTSPFSISNLGPVKCETAKAFSGWARFGVDRAAREILGSRLERIETMGSYSCRNVSGTNRRSAHATGNAIDVSGFVLADGRRIDLKRDWNGGTRAEREFLRVVHRSACKRFGTVLGPDYDAAHRDHFHVEGTDTQFCR